MSQLYLKIRADYNDGDYVEDLFKISKKDLDELRPVIKIIKSKRGNWDEHDEVYKDLLTEEQIEDINSMLPSAPDACEIHSIDEMTVYEVESEEELL